MVAPAEKNSNQQSLLEKLRRESGGRDVLGFAVYRLDEIADMQTFLREYLQFQNPSGDANSKITVFKRTRANLFGEMEDPSVSNGNRDGWIKALDANTPSTEKATQRCHK